MTALRAMYTHSCLICSEEISKRDELKVCECQVNNSSELFSDRSGIIQARGLLSTQSRWVSLQLRVSITIKQSQLKAN